MTTVSPTCHDGAITILYKKTGRCVRIQPYDTAPRFIKLFQF